MVAMSCVKVIVGGGGGGGGGRGWGHATPGEI